jgi:SAM-dependent methyltransferase
MDNPNTRRKLSPRDGFRVVDLCCGVGFSTRALRDAFSQPDTTVIGIDTSPEMVRCNTYTSIVMPSHSSCQIFAELLLLLSLILNIHATNNNNKIRLPWRILSRVTSQR